MAGSSFTGAEIAGNLQAVSGICPGCGENVQHAERGAAAERPRGRRGHWNRGNSRAKGSDGTGQPVGGGATETTGLQGDIVRGDGCGCDPCTQAGGGAGGGSG